MNDEKLASGFAPKDLSDGRASGQWQTRYPDKVAKKAIAFEACYVTIMFALCPVFLYLIWRAQPFEEDVGSSLPIFQAYLFGWVGGLLGGTLFCLKWLYHSVAHEIWNADRRLWRLLSPHLSAALAFIFVCLIDSGIITLFDPGAVKTPSMVISISFLIGYFSDTALAKLSDVAYSLFGSAGRDSGKKGVKK